MDTELAEIIQILTERGRQNTLTLGHVSTLCRDILLELRKPASDDNPLVEALKALIEQGKRHSAQLTRIEALVKGAER